MKKIEIGTITIKKTITSNIFIRMRLGGDENSRKRHTSKVKLLPRDR